MMKTYKNIAKILLILSVCLVVLSFTLTPISNAMVLKGKEWIVTSRYPEATKAGALMFPTRWKCF